MGILPSNSGGNRLGTDCGLVFCMKEGLRIKNNIDEMAGKQEDCLGESVQQDLRVKICQGKHNSHLPKGGL